MAPSREYVSDSQLQGECDRPIENTLIYFSIMTSLSFAIVAMAFTRHPLLAL